MTDEELIRRWKEAGSESDLRELLDRHFDQVRWLVLCSVGSPGPSNNGCGGQVDDLVQEIMIKTVRNLDRFENRSSFSSWLYRIAINTSRTFLSAQGPRTEPFSDEMSTPNREPGPEQVAELNELDAAVRTAIAKLPPSLRNTISLIALDGISPNEVAEIEQCPISSVYRRLHDARKILKEQLKHFLN